MAKRQKVTNIEPLHTYSFDTPSWEPDKHQKEFLKSMNHSLVTFCDASAGTGKTTLAVWSGFKHLSRGDVRRIVYIRFVDDRFKQNGFYPGTLEEKEQHLFYPFFDALTELSIGDRQYEMMIQQEEIALMTDTTLRGRNIKDSFVIIDEAQNAHSIEDLRLVLTRVHDSCKVVVIGHSKQRDNRQKQKVLPFQLYKEHMAKKDFTKVCELITDYRGQISAWADQIEGGSI